MIQKETVQHLKAIYPKGTRVKLVRMDDIHAPTAGTEGTVELVDDIGTVHVSWDSGQHLGVVYGEDEICRITDPAEEKANRTHKVEVTLELICRKAFTLDLSDEDYNMLLEGDCAPLVEQGLFEETRADADEEIDYTVFDLDQNRQVVDWR